MQYDIRPVVSTGETVAYITLTNLSPPSNILSGHTNNSLFIPSSGFAEFSLICRVTVGLMSNNPVVRHRTHRQVTVEATMVLPRSHHGARNIGVSLFDPHDSLFDPPLLRKYNGN
jgi:hypothetical protein